jgi:hypothetical protein
MDFESYSHRARYLASKVFPDVPKGYEIDHVYSIRDGYDNAVPVEIISHRRNLRIIDRFWNRTKGSKSDITLSQLFKITSEPYEEV